MAGRDVRGKPIAEGARIGNQQTVNYAAKHHHHHHVFMERKYKDGKHDEAVNYAENHVYQTTSYPPQVIKNEQWSEFSHVKTEGTASGSERVVVYRGKNKDGKVTEWVQTWNNPNGNIDNQAYAEMNETGYFDRINGQTIGNGIENVGRQYYEEHEEYTTGGGTSPVYESVNKRGAISYN